MASETVTQILSAEKAMHSTVDAAHSEAEKILSDAKARLQENAVRRQEQADKACAEKLRENEAAIAAIYEQSKTNNDKEIAALAQRIAGKAAAAQQAVIRLLTE